jgi:glutaminyl-peptide cyclotransferase
MYKPQRPIAFFILFFLLSAIFIVDTAKLTAQSTPELTSQPTPESTPPVDNIPRLIPKVISKKPHNTTSFTEGLVWDNGVFYESSGLYGTSTLRKVEIETGNILMETKLGDKFFAEGLAMVDDRLIQLTWNEHIAFIYNKEFFNVMSGFIYDGEGWGLCYDGSQIFMSNGSNIITVRDPLSFALTKELSITLNGQPVTNMNELECVDDSLYVNIWQTNNIYRLNKETGEITGIIDAAGLLTPEELQKAGSDGVLNGIAYNTTTKAFYITGKLWPWLFEVDFAPAN